MKRVEFSRIFAPGFVTIGFGVNVVIGDGGVSLSLVLCGYGLTVYLWPWDLGQWTE